MGSSLFQPLEACDRSIVVAGSDDVFSMLWGMVPGERMEIGHRKKRHPESFSRLGWGL